MHHFFRPFILLIVITSAAFITQSHAFAQTLHTLTDTNNTARSYTAQKTNVNQSSSGHLKQLSASNTIQGNTSPKKKTSKNEEDNDGTRTREKTKSKTARTPFLKANPDDFKGMHIVKEEQIVKIIDPITIQFKNGELAALSGLDIPDYTLHEPGPLSQSAMVVLRDQLLGEMVSCYGVKNQKDGLKNRMNQRLCQIIKKDGQIWMQGLLLELGIARIRTTHTNTDMIAQMRAAEKKAENAKAGLWASPQYKTLTADQAAKADNSYALIQGKVYSASKHGSTLYLNFTKNWRKDFTIQIPSSALRRFRKQGIDPLTLQNKTLRVRGWVQSYNGPYIEIDHPARIEIIEAPPPQTQKDALPADPEKWKGE